MSSISKIIVISATIITYQFGGTALATPFLWDKSAGGNGHYYELVDSQILWDQAKANAESMTFLGVHGYLATITSATENNFVASTFAPILAQLPSAPIIAWLGGYQPTGSSEPAGGWSWITGEPWAYSNWNPVEPNNAFGCSGCKPENQLAFVIKPVSNFTIGQWSDADGVDTTDINVNQAYYIVEYATSIPEPATISLFSLGLAGLYLGKRRNQSSN